MDQDLLIKAYEASIKGQSYAFATIIDSTLKGTPRKAGAKMIVLQDGTIFGSIGGGRNELAAIGECKKALKAGKPFVVTYDYFGQKGQSVCGGQIKVFVEPFISKKRFIICGGGHIALPLSVLAKMMGFFVVVIDNRKEFANKKRFPHIDQIQLGEYAQKLSEIELNENTFVMIVTQGNEHDFDCLKYVIGSQAVYIGVISSLAKRVKFLKRLKVLGVNQKLFKRIDIPAGLDIGAQTPEEIAVSIASKVVSVKNSLLIGSSKFNVNTQ